MDKRDEIREHAIIDLMNYKAFDRLPCEYIVDCVLQSLDLEGVVIKVDRELPGVPPLVNELGLYVGYLRALEDMKDYVATERLIDDTSP